MLSSCLFIFCFFILERASVFMLKTFLYFFMERTLDIDPFTPTSGYILISLFFGIHDMAPILVSVVNDGFLGGYKSLVLFGFVFVFGISLIALFNGSWFAAPLGPAWCSIFALLTLVAVSAGGLVPSLTAFGGSQFHPQEQTSQGSRFFTFIFAALNLGALIGVAIAIIIQAQYAYRYVLLWCAVSGLLGYLLFLAGSGLYVKRCVHSSTALRTIRLICQCALRFSFDKNRRSNGGNFDDELVDDVRIFYRLVPVFLCLIPLYLGQLQVFTTFRTLGYKLLRPESFFNKTSMPPEIILVVDPITAILCSLLLDQLVFPLLSNRRLMCTHLTRLTIGAVCVALGFFVSFALQRVLMTQYASELDLRFGVSIFYLVPQLVLFSVGQFLIVSSGYALAYTHAPDSIRAVSVSVFSMIYSTGSILSIIVFACMRPWLDEAGRSVWEGSSTDHSIESRLDVYFLLIGCMSTLSVVGLVSLRKFYEKTRLMRIDREVEKKAIRLVLDRIQSQLKEHKVQYSPVVMYQDSLHQSTSSSFQRKSTIDSPICDKLPFV